MLHFVLLLRISLDTLLRRQSSPAFNMAGAMSLEDFLQSPCARIMDDMDEANETGITLGDLRSSEATVYGKSFYYSLSKCFFLWRQFKIAMIYTSCKVNPT